MSGEASTNHVPKMIAPAMAKVFNLLVECGTTEMTLSFHTATKIGMKPEYSELFMLTRDKENLFHWVPKEHEAISKHYVVLFALIGVVISELFIFLCMNFGMRFTLIVIGWPDSHMTQGF